MGRNQTILTGFAHRFWTDEDNLSLVTTFLPHRVHLFQSLPSGVIRADIARCLYLHAHGGIYADTDYKFFRCPPDTMLAHSVLLGIEDPHSPDLNTAKLGNAFMGSVQGHPLWIDFVESAFERFLAGQTNPLFIAGPHALTLYLQSHPSFMGTINLLDQHIIYPSFDPFKVSAQNPQTAIGVHLCWGSWRKKAFLQRIKSRIRRGLSAVL